MTSTLKNDMNPIYDKLKLSITETLDAANQRLSDIWKKTLTMSRDDYALTLRSDKSGFNPDLIKTIEDHKTAMIDDPEGVDASIKRSKDLLDTYKGKVKKERKPKAVKTEIKPE